MLPIILITRELHGAAESASDFVVVLSKAQLAVNGHELQLCFILRVCRNVITTRIITLGMISTIQSNKFSNGLCLVMCEVRL